MRFPTHEVLGEKCLSSGKAFQYLVLCNLIFGLMAVPAWPDLRMQGGGLGGIPEVVSKMAVGGQLYKVVFDRRSEWTGCCARARAFWRGAVLCAARRAFAPRRARGL